MESLCDSCYAPGACCRVFVLSDAGGRPMLYDREADRWTLKPNKNPFEVNAFVGHVERDGKQMEQWDWRCTALQPDGRCGVYEDRPQLCRDFEPGSAPLCVHYRGAESGDASAGFPEPP